MDDIYIYTLIYDIGDNLDDCILFHGKVHGIYLKLRLLIIYKRLRYIFHAFPMYFQQQKHDDIPAILSDGFGFFHGPIAFLGNDHQSHCKDAPYDTM